MGVRVCMMCVCVCVGVGVCVEVRRFNFQFRSKFDQGLLIESKQQEKHWKRLKIIGNCKKP